MMKKLLHTLLASLFLSLSVSAWAMDPPEPDSYTTEQVATYQKQAEQGDRVAQYRLGWAYENGLGDLEYDPEKALDWYEKSAKQGYYKAYSQIGYLFDDCGPLATDYVKARVYYEHALKIEPNDPLANHFLGWLYTEGDGVKQDVAKGIEFLKKAAQGNYQLSTLRLGDIYRDGIHDVKVDWDEAAKWYQTDADRGHPLGQLYLAELYYNEDNPNKKKKKAFDLFLKLAEQAPADSSERIRAASYLGYIYLNGEGAEQDYKQSKKWLEIAANGDDLTAIYNLAETYRNGYGVKKDINKARKLYSQACEEGYGDSCEIHDQLKRKKAKR